MRHDESKQKSRMTHNAGASVRSAACLALIVVSAAGGVTEGMTEREVRFKTSDGWQITGSMLIPERDAKMPAVILVHGSRHEKDAYGQALPKMFSDHGIAMLRIDIRGRGASREPLSFHSMAPEQRRGVRLDIEAAIEFLASQPGVDRNRIGIVAEQDSADAALVACQKERRVVAYTLLSGRLNEPAKEAASIISAPVFCLVSKEDRRGFKDMVDIYLASNNPGSRLKVFEGIGFGTTMFSAWQYEFPDEQPIEQMIADWMAESLKSGDSSRAARSKR